MPKKRFTAVAKRHQPLRANSERAAVAAAARAQAVTAAPPVARPTPRGRRGRPRRQVAGVKNIEGPVRNKRG